MIIKCLKHSTYRFVWVGRLGLWIAFSAQPGLARAQAYGEGGYGGLTYGGLTITIPGIGTLPVTGQSASLALILAAVLSIAIGFVVWRRRQKPRI